MCTSTIAPRSACASLLPPMLDARSRPVRAEIRAGATVGMQGSGYRSGNAGCHSVWTDAVPELQPGSQREMGTEDRLPRNGAHSMLSPLMPSLSDDAGVYL